MKRLNFQVSAGGATFDSHARVRRTNDMAHGAFGMSGTIDSKENFNERGSPHNERRCSLSRKVVPAFVRAGMLR